MRRLERRKKKSEIIEIAQTENSDMLRTTEPFSPQPRLQDKLVSVIAKRISKLQNLEKMRVIKNVMHNLYGRHNPIDHKPEFNFQETWQTNSKQATLEDKYNVLKTENFLYISLHLTLCILFGFAAWFFSIYRIFQVDGILIYLIAMIGVAIILDGVNKQNNVFESMIENNMGQVGLNVKDYLRLHWVGLLMLLYLCFILLQNFFFTQQKCNVLFLLDLVLVIVSYTKFKELYAAIKIKILASRFRNEIMIAQLFGGCILLVHIFGVVLYIVSFSDPINNWRIHVDNFEVSWLSKYIYSVYFACTSALTVGYGDITPRNLLEIVTILFVEVFGLINMGYIVNQIGRILSKMNENQELLHKNISDASQIIKNYNLPPSLSTKMKTYIMNNQKATNELNIEEEDHFLRRLNDQLREEITFYNQIQIIKNSVFFICHWSKKFQRIISTKLIRCIYSPQETINQIRGNEKLFILTKGKLSIQAFFQRGCSHSFKKSLHILEFNPAKEVQFNTYGYSALVSGLTINLKAVAKDYSICYRVDKEDILSAIVEDESDFQYFHEIKVRIQQSRYKEIWEAPSISNTRQHYLPNPYYVIQKDKNNMIKTNQHQKRKSVLRKFNRTKCYIESQPQLSDPDLDSDKNESDTEIVFNLSISPPAPEKNEVLTDKQRKQKYKAIQDSERSQCIVTNRKYRKKYPRKIEVIQNLLDTRSEDKKKILTQFEEFKIFKFYLPKFNFSKITERFNRMQGERNGTASKSSLTRAFESLGPDLIEKLLSIKRLGTNNSTSSFA